MVYPLLHPQHRFGVVSPVPAQPLDDKTDLNIRSAMSLVTAAATLAANKIVFNSAVDYFETAIAVLMFFIGLAISTLFYMVHSIWKL